MYNELDKLFDKYSSLIIKDRNGEVFKDGGLEIEV
jgi:hypothetical protein